MWLPKYLYESIPFHYLGLGAIGLAAAFTIDAWHWAEVMAAGGLIAVVTGLVLLRRKGYRSSRSHLDFDNLN